LLVVAKLFASLAFARTAAVLVAFDINAVGSSHGLEMSGANAGGSRQGGRLISSSGGCMCGKFVVGGMSRCLVGI
jgi:hypothetical protein